METYTKIAENLNVKETKKRNISAISIIDSGIEKQLSDKVIHEFFWHNWTYDENYVVTYTRGCMMNNIPLNVEAAYSIKNHHLLDITDEKTKIVLEYMFFFKKGFTFAEVLSLINPIDLGIIPEENKGRLKKYLTLGNPDISDEEVIAYIIQEYPKLKDHMNYEKPLTALEYIEIEEKIGKKIFNFHAMPQDIEELNLQQELDSPDKNDYWQIYNSVTSHQHKIFEKKDNRS